MEVKIEKNEDITTVKFIGRLDTPASQEVAKTLMPLERDATGTFILDCEELEYISSSGLRIFLSRVKQSRFAKLADRLCFYISRFLT